MLRVYSIDSEPNATDFISSVTGSRKSIVYHNENQLCYWATFVYWLTEARTHNTTCACNQIVFQHAKLAANWLSYFMLASCFTRL